MWLMTPFGFFSIVEKPLGNGQHAIKPSIGRVE